MFLCNLELSKKKKELYATALTFFYVYLVHSLILGKSTEPLALVAKKKTKKRGDEKKRGRPATAVAQDVELKIPRPCVTRA